MSANEPDLKGYDEEKLDRWLFRPLAHPAALLGGKLGMTPNVMSVVGMLFGIAGAYFFQFQEASLVVWGVALFGVRNILDYADGQLARLTGRGTTYGSVFDGFCDYLAYVGIYVFGMVGILPEYGGWAVPLVLAAAWSGGVQGSLLEFFKHEYRFWALGADKDRFRSSGELAEERTEARGFDRFLLRLAIGYAANQQRVAASRLKRYEAWQSLRHRRAFRERYSLLNRGPLKGWFLVGPNWQAYLFFAFGLLGRMDIFFFVQLLGMNLVAAVTLALQGARDEKLSGAFPAESPQDSPA